MRKNRLRKRYRAPKLTGYGDVAKLTLGGPITGIDMGGMMMCL